MDGWNLVEPFNIDNGELDGIRSGECFCLGVEFHQFRVMLLTGKPFTTLCLANNAKRLSAMAERHGRFVEHAPSETEGWATITVGNKKSSND